MNAALYALAVIFALNAWVMCGSIVLLRSIDRGAVKRPQSVVHALCSMLVWPGLALRLVAMRPRPAAPRPDSPSPAR